MVDKKVHYPGTKVGEETKMVQLPEEYVLDDGVTSRTVINKQLPDIGPSVFKVL